MRTQQKPNHNFPPEKSLHGDMEIEELDFTEYSRQRAEIDLRTAQLSLDKLRRDLAEGKVSPTS